MSRPVTCIALGSNGFGEELGVAEWRGDHDVCPQCGYVDCLGDWCDSSDGYLAETDAALEECSDVGDDEV